MIEVWWDDEFWSGNSKSGGREIMHQVVGDPPKCMVCGSANSETYTRATESGIRCLDCKHSKIISTTTSTTTDGSPRWIYMPERDNTF